MNPSSSKHEPFCVLLLDARLGVISNVVSVQSYAYCLEVRVTLSTVSPLLSQASQGGPAVQSQQYELDKRKRSSGATLTK